jgi:hypothetical protein
MRFVGVGDVIAGNITVFEREFNFRVTGYDNEDFTIHQDPTDAPLTFNVITDGFVSNLLEIRIRPIAFDWVRKTV